MRRRGLAASAAAVPLVQPKVGRAQVNAKALRIRWIWHGRSIGPPQATTGFRLRLKEFGYVEGQTIVVDSFVSYQPEMAAQFLQRRLPAVSELRLMVETGGLLSYGPSIFDASGDWCISWIGSSKQLRPADLPVEQASKLELVVSLKTAKLLNNTLPKILLAGADEVVE